MENLTDRGELVVPRDEQYVSPTFLADHWGVHINTVYRDIGKGAIPAHRMPSGRLRVRWFDAKRYGRPIE